MTSPLNGMLITLHRTGAPRHPIRLHQTEPALFRFHVSQPQHLASYGSRTSPGNRRQDSRFLRQPRRRQPSHEFCANIRANRRDHRKYSVFAE